MPTELDTHLNNPLQPYLYPQDARMESARLGPNQTLAKGRVLGLKTSDKRLYPYASGASDGTQVPVGILVRDTATDVAGNHYSGSTAAVSRYNLPHQDGQLYVAGTFLPADLTGWDANAATVMHARVLPSGAIRIP